jgi:ribosomal protein S18 acetylase RimI-like enzyme
VRIVRASAAVAQAQAGWIAALEPWRGLGYRAAALGRYLARMAGAHEVWVARAGADTRAPIAAVVAVQDGVLLGAFVGLLAVRPDAAGAGLGTRLMEHVAARVLAERRWLYVSCDSGNAGALRFYRRLGFARVGRLPDLVKPGSVEILLRRGRVR